MSFQISPIACIENRKENMNLQHIDINMNKEAKKTTLSHKDYIFVSYRFLRDVLFLNFVLFSSFFLIPLFFYLKMTLTRVYTETSSRSKT